MAREGCAEPVPARYYQVGADRPIFDAWNKSIHDDTNDL